MKYVILFWLLAVALALLAAIPRFVGLQIAIAVPALTFALVGCAYAARQPQLFGKSPEGEQSIFSWLVFGLFFLMSRCTLRLYRLANRRQPALAEAAPGLWFGRRLTSLETNSLAVKFAVVLDLAAEFPRAPVACESYRSLPLLDGLPVSAADLATALQCLAQSLPNGQVLVHCALGHGRTGSIILAWLLTQHLISNLAEGVALLKKLRPGFGISSAQLTAVQHFADGHNPSSA